MKTLTVVLLYNVDCQADSSCYFDFFKHVNVLTAGFVTHSIQFKQHVNITVHIYV